MPMEEIRFTLPRFAATGRRGERGAVGILLAVVIVAMLGVAAFVIDIGRGLVTQAELQNAGDAGTLAAARELSLIYQALPSTTSNRTYELTSADKARILGKASEWTSQNEAGNVPVSLLASDLVYGTYDTATGAITPSSTGVRAISLRARRDASANGVLQTTLGRVLGINELSVRATAAAALTALGTLPPGAGDIPVGISSYWFENHECGPDSTIKFYPTGSMDGCAGWHTFDDYPANAHKLGTILNGLRSGAYESPETTAGETTYNFIGGSVAVRFNEMKALYDANKDADGNWSVLVPVYQSSNCSNPSGPITIVGFARARIFSVKTAPSMSITANVECGVVDIGSGNGPNDYGVLFSRPAMVQ